MSSIFGSLIYSDIHFFIYAKPISWICRTSQEIQINIKHQDQKNTDVNRRHEPVGKPKHSRVDPAARPGPESQLRHLLAEHMYRVTVPQSPCL